MSGCLSVVFLRLQTGLDLSHVLFHCNVVATFRLPVSELRCRQSSANEERLVRLQTVLKPVSLGGMDDGQTVGLKFEAYLIGGIRFDDVRLLQIHDMINDRCWMLFCMK